MEIIRSSPHAAPMETSDGQVVRSQGGKNARPGVRDLQKFSSSKISNLNDLGGSYGPWSAPSAAIALPHIIGACTREECRIIKGTA